MLKTILNLDIIDTHTEGEPTIHNAIINTACFNFLHGKVFPGQNFHWPTIRTVLQQSSPCHSGQGNTGCAALTS